MVYNFFFIMIKKLMNGLVQWYLGQYQACYMLRKRGNSDNHNYS